MSEGPLQRWLVHVRRLFLAADALLLSTAFVSDERPVIAAAMFLLFLLVEGGRTAFGGRWSAPTAGVVDLVAFTATAAAWGEPHQPLQVFWLVDVALFAVFSPPAWGTAAAAASVVGAAVAIAAPVVVGVSDEPPLHLAAHLGTYALGAAAIALVLGAVGREARAAEVQLRRSEEERGRAARLAAIGSLAAGVAHELATPLGSVELLAEEVAHRPAALDELRGELDRCRAILDRLLARGEAGEGATVDLPAAVRSWVDTWRKGSPDVPLEVDAGDVPRGVRGGPDGWRAAVWTVLDNARRAGPPIRVVLRATPSGAELRVEDGGPGVSDTVAARIGEPFVSEWPDRSGAGLGLYVARSFACEVGGDLRLERVTGGTAAVLTLRTVGS